MGVCSYEMKSAWGFWELSGARDLVKQCAFMFQATQEAEAGGSSEYTNVKPLFKESKSPGISEPPRTGWPGR